MLSVSTPSSNPVSSTLKPPHNSIVSVNPIPVQATTISCLDYGITASSFALLLLIRNKSQSEHNKPYQKVSLFCPSAHLSPCPQHTGNYISHFLPFCSSCTRHLLVTCAALWTHQACFSLRPFCLLFFFSYVTWLPCLVWIIIHHHLHSETYSLLASTATLQVLIPIPV
jgi:hypothetical protein